MADAEIDPDVELYLTGFIRTELAARSEVGGFVSNREWSPPASNPNARPPVWQVIVRDDGVVDGELIVADAAVGISVLAGTMDNPGEAMRLARIVKAIVKTTPADFAGPVTVVRSFTGPYRIQEPALYARAYMTCSLGIQLGI